MGAFTHSLLSCEQTGITHSLTCRSQASIGVAPQSLFRLARYRLRAPAGAGKTGVGGGGSGLAVATAAPKPTAIALTTLAGSAPARNICVFIEVPRLVRSDLDADSIAV